MKTFNILAIVALVIAVAGILSQGGRATTISYLSCVPLLFWVLALLIKGFQGWLASRTK